MAGFDAGIGRGVSFFRDTRILGLDGESSLPTMPIIYRRLRALSTDSGRRRLKNRGQKAFLAGREITESHSPESSK